MCINIKFSPTITARLSLVKIFELFFLFTQKPCIFCSYQQDDSDSMRHQSDFFGHVDGGHLLETNWPPKKTKDQMLPKWSTTKATIATGGGREQHKLMADFSGFDGISGTSFLNVPCECPCVKRFFPLFFFSLSLSFSPFLTSKATQQKATDAKPPSNPCVYLSTVVSLNTDPIISRIWANFHLFVGLGYSFFNFDAWV